MQTFVLHDETVLKRLDAFLRANWLACARSMRPLAVTVAEHKAKRSRAQNNLYWDMLRALAEQGWVNGKQFSADAWHQHFRRTFIGSDEVALPGGEVITIGISTTTLNTAQMSAYIDRIALFAAEELGVEIGVW